MSQFIYIPLKTISEPKILDMFPGATVAFSLRLLSDTYTGDCIRVRRSSDDETAEIGFVDGYIDTATLLDFVGGGDGFIERLYDQSGNENRASQTTTTSQPKIVSSGSLITEGSLGILDFTHKYLSLSSPITLNSEYTLFSVGRRTGLGGLYVTMAGSQTAPVSALGYFPDSGLTNRPLLIRANGYALGNTTDSSTAMMTFSAIAKSGSNEIYKNGNLYASTSDSSSFPNTYNYIGRYASLIGDGGRMGELILYNSNEASNFVATDANQKTYYSIS